jgi:hypothetical protein
MNLGRGLFRLWIALSLVWVASAAWVLRFELMLNCHELFEYYGGKTDDYLFGLCHIHPWTLEARALAWILLPPFAALLLGLWVFRGFTPKNSN